MISYESLSASLHNLGLDQDAAEYHGILCGMLCYRDDAPEDLGLAAEAESQVCASDTELQALRKNSLQQLQHAHVEFCLMLPDDDETLDQRVEALAQWVSGFLHGLARNPGMDMRELSEDSQELIRDFTELSRAGLEAESGQGQEQDERDYTELVEYVRVGAQLLFLELRQTQATPASDDDRLH